MLAALRLTAHYTLHGPQLGQLLEQVEPDVRGEQHQVLGHAAGADRGELVARRAVHDGGIGRPQGEPRAAVPVQVRDMLRIKYTTRRSRYPYTF